MKAFMRISALLFISLSQVTYASFEYQFTIVNNSGQDIKISSSNLGCNFNKSPNECDCSKNMEASTQIQNQFQKYDYTFKKNSFVHFMLNLDMDESCIKNFKGIELGFSYHAQNNKDAGEIKCSLNSDSNNTYMINNGSSQYRCYLDRHVAFGSV